MGAMVGEHAGRGSHKYKMGSADRRRPCHSIQRDALEVVLRSLHLSVGTAAQLHFDCPATRRVRVWRVQGIPASLPRPSSPVGIGDKVGFFLTQRSYNEARARFMLSGMSVNRSNVIGLSTDPLNAALTPSVIKQGWRQVRPLSWVQSSCVLL